MPGGGGDYHPSAEKLTKESFETGFDHSEPTSWIAVGSIWLKVKY